MLWAQEYALPKGRKIDPLFDMDAFRAAVKSFMDGTAPPPTPIPAIDSGGRPTLRRGARGDLVRPLQAKLGVIADGIFGANTEATLRQFQRDKGLVPDGITGPKTWAALN